MSERIGFHGNMVIWQDHSNWNGFGLFGQSVHGKTPLSYAFAHRIITEGLNPVGVKVIDDGYNMRGGKISCLAGHTGGNPDLLGICDQLKIDMMRRGLDITLLQPNQYEEFPLNNVTIWLLLFTHEADASPLNGERYKKVSCAYESFIPALMKTNPLWAEGLTEINKENMVRRGLKPSWTYFKITREQQIDYSRAT